MALSLKRRIEHQLALRVGIPLAYFVFRIICLTLRREHKGFYNDFVRTVREGQRYVIAFWHDDSFYMAMDSKEFLRLGEICIMTSPGRDGALMARFLRMVGARTTPGSTTHGGAKGLLDLIRSMSERDFAALAVDGSRRAPRFSVQPGVLMLAKRTGLPIVSIAIQSNKKWILGSKDRIEVPHPFARTTIFYGEPLIVPAKCDATEMEEIRCNLERQLFELKGLASGIKDQ